MRCVLCCVFCVVWCVLCVVCCVLFVVVCCVLLLLLCVVVVAARGTNSSLQDQGNRRTTTREHDNITIREHQHKPRTACLDYKTQKMKTAGSNNALNRHPERIRRTNALLGFRPLQSKSLPCDRRLWDDITTKQPKYFPHVMNNFLS